MRKVKQDYPFSPFCPFYCLTSWETDVIEAQLRKRGIVGASYLDTGSRWRLWKIPGDQVHKLPFHLGYEDRYYSSPYYLPCSDEDGYSIYPMHPRTLAKDEARPGAYWVMVT